MKHNHQDILHIEKVARERSLSAEQVRLALNAYMNGGRSARRLLATLGLLAAPPEPEEQWTEEQLRELEAQLQPSGDDQAYPPDFLPEEAEPTMLPWR